MMTSEIQKLGMVLKEFLASDEYSSVDTYGNFHSLCLDGTITIDQETFELIKKVMSGEDKGDGS